MRQLGRGREPEDWEGSGTEESWGHHWLGAVGPMGRQSLSCLTRRCISELHVEPTSTRQSRKYCARLCFFHVPKIPPSPSIATQRRTPSQQLCSWRPRALTPSSGQRLHGHCTGEVHCFRLSPER